VGNCLPVTIIVRPY